MGYLFVKKIFIKSGFMKEIMEYFRKYRIKMKIFL
jgi:hypothetical protein